MNMVNQEHMYYTPRIPKTPVFFEGPYFHPFSQRAPVSMSSFFCI